jgi:hypothetical protein
MGITEHEISTFLKLRHMLRCLIIQRMHHQREARGRNSRFRAVAMSNTVWSLLVTVFKQLRLTRGLPPASGTACRTRWCVFGRGLGVCWQPRATNSNFVFVVLGEQTKS